MSAQLQLLIQNDAQWSAFQGAVDANGNLTVSAPVGYRKLYAIRVQVPTNKTSVLAGFVDFQYIQNSIERLPSNTDPFRMPVTNDTEVVLYTPPNPALPLQFTINDLYANGVRLEPGTVVRLFLLHTLTQC